MVRRSVPAHPYARSLDDWRLEIPECPPQDVAALRRELSVSDALAQALVRRGLGEPAQARAFLDASEQHDPSLFEGIGAAVASIARHIDERRRITVHGDYDVDGVCSTAVMVTALRRLGADVDWYLPDRAGDGYGLSKATIERLAARGTSLLVSVDCGVSAVEEVEAALALGLEVVITDHHSPRADGCCRGPRSCTPASVGIPAATCAPRRSSTSSRRPCTWPADATRSSSRPSSTWWRWRRSPTWSHCWARTAT